MKLFTDVKFIISVVFAGVLPQKTAMAVGSHMFTKVRIIYKKVIPTKSTNRNKLIWLPKANKQTKLTRFASFLKRHISYLNTLIVLLVVLYFWGVSQW